MVFGMPCGVSRLRYERSMCQQSVSGGQDPPHSLFVHIAPECHGLEESSDEGGIFTAHLSAHFLHHVRVAQIRIQLCLWSQREVSLMVPLPLLHTLFTQASSVTCGEVAKSGARRRGALKAVAYVDKDTRATVTNPRSDMEAFQTATAERSTRGVRHSLQPLSGAIRCVSFVEVQAASTAPSVLRTMVTS
eukprot:scaffold907_cov247-Pinguiococcus_pyrenoidosus.AAC.6